MTPILRSILAGLAVTALLAGPAVAHQRQLFQIGTGDYLVIVGFLNEPVLYG
jgi:hypothetical protein